MGSAPPQPSCFFDCRLIYFPQAWGGGSISGSAMSRGNHNQLPVSPPGPAEPALSGTCKTKRVGKSRGEFPRKGKKISLLFARLPPSPGRAPGAKWMPPKGFPGDFHGPTPHVTSFPNLLSQAWYIWEGKPHYCTDFTNFCSAEDGKGTTYARNRPVKYLFTCLKRPDEEKGGIMRNTSWFASSSLALQVI